jgi:hypothetical protein
MILSPFVGPIPARVMTNRKPVLALKDAASGYTLEGKTAKSRRQSSIDRVTAERTAIHDHRPSTEHRE